MKQKNKIALFIMVLAAASMLVQSCGKDNMKYPSSTISGRFTYQNQPVGLIFSNPDIIATAGSTTAAMLLQQKTGAQPAYGVGEVSVYTRHDGSFTGKFFDGDYLARTQGGKVPFEDFTNKPFSVKGDTNFGNVEVVPYWWMNNLATTYAGGVFTATFNLTKPSANTARTLDRVYIFLSPDNTPDIQSSTQGAVRSFVAGVNAGGIVVPAAASSGGAVTVKFDLNTLTAGEKQFLRAFGNNSTIWASVAVKTTSVTDALYSDPIKLQLP
nr:DUF3823 domain-containing protein [uncultured Mucilaginibacter sp.]